jgi:chromosome segregation ATPase
MELVAFLKQIESEYADKQAKVAALGTEIGNLTVQRDKLQAIVEPLKAERDGLQSDIATLKGKLADARQASTTLINDIAIQTARLANLTAQIESAKKLFDGALAAVRK